MAAGDYTFSFNGVSFGVGTNIQILKATGLEDLPALRNSDKPRPRDTGEFLGLDFANGRDVVFDLLVLDGGTTPTDFFTTISNLEAATVPIQSGTLPLQFQLPGRINRQLNARPRKRSFPVDVDYQYRFGKPIIEFHCPDPRIYDANLQTVTVSLPTSSGGLSWPLAWPLSWGSASSGSVQVTNTGNFNTRPVVVFNGPSTAPQIQNVTTGLTWASNITLNNGDTLTVDFDAKTVLLNGTSSRYSTMLTTSVWWEIIPGVNSLKYIASAGTGTAQVSFRSAWM